MSLIESFVEAIWPFQVRGWAYDANAPEDHGCHLDGRGGSRCNRPGRCFPRWCANRPRWGAPNATNRMQENPAPRFGRLGLAASLTERRASCADSSMRSRAPPSARNAHASRK
jgi:hypothetical protein